MLDEDFIEEDDGLVEELPLEDEEDILLRDSGTDFSGRGDRKPVDGSLAKTDSGFALYAGVMYLARWSIEIDEPRVCDGR